VSLGPLQLSGLTLHLEVCMTLAPTESERFRIVADEGDTLARVYGPV
jgi:hypothetical protein